MSTSVAPSFRNIPCQGDLKLRPLPLDNADPSSLPKELQDAALRFVKAKTEAAYNRRLIQLLELLLPLPEANVPPGANFEFVKADEAEMDETSLKGLRVESAVDGRGGIVWAQTRVARDYAQCLGIFAAIKQGKLREDNLADKLTFALRDGLVGPYVPDVMGYASSRPGSKVPQTHGLSPRGSADTLPTLAPSPPLPPVQMRPSAPAILGGSSSASLPGRDAEGNLPMPPTKKRSFPGPLPPLREESKPKHRDLRGLLTALAFLVAEMKVKKGELKYGVAKAMCYLHSTHEVCGCWIGLVVLAERYARMLVLQDNVIVIETGEPELIGRSVSAVELLDLIKPEQLPWAFGSYDPDEENWQLNDLDIRTLWNTAHLAASLVADKQYTQPLERLPRPDIDGLPSWANLRQRLAFTSSVPVSTTASRLGLYSSADSDERGRRMAELQRLVTTWQAVDAGGQVDWAEVVRRMSSQTSVDAKDGAPPGRKPDDEDKDENDRSSPRRTVERAAATENSSSTSAPAGSATTMPTGALSGGGGGSEVTRRGVLMGNEGQYRSRTPPLTPDTASGEIPSSSPEHSSASDLDPSAAGLLAVRHRSEQDDAKVTRDWPVFGEGPKLDDGDSGDEELSASEQMELELRIMTIVLARAGIKVLLVSREEMTRLIEEGAGNAAIERH